MTTTPAIPEPFAWAWRNKVTGAKGVYFEDPKPFGITSHPDYEWTNLYTEAQPIATLQAQPAEVSDAEIDALCLSLTGFMTRKERDRAVARAILALLPQAVPMTDAGSPGLKRHAIEASDRLARYAAAPFFPETAKRGVVRQTTPEWWDGLAELIEEAQPLIARAQDEFKRAHHGITAPAGGEVDRG